jgi:phosphoenolpyruvate carboxylase
MAKIAPQSAEFRTRRESLNQLRRAIKSEIEGVFQSDQLRPNPIPVQSEARRLMQRYSVIFRVFPFQQKFIKRLVKEAYFLFLASSLSTNEEFVHKFAQLYEPTKHTREERFLTIKKTCQALGINTSTAPNLNKPVITFGTWKGGDRDGNPFVVASFSNQTFIEQKLYVLQHYLTMVTELVDKITPSLSHVDVSGKLIESVKKDRGLFPYIENIKPQEPYRAKLRYMMEKLQNTVIRTSEVLKKAGETTKPLLSSTMLGPSGYNDRYDFQNDIDVIYQSLVHHSGKGQARSSLQDLKILASTFGLHMVSIDFRQTSNKNAEAVVEYLQQVAHPVVTDFAPHLKSLESFQKAPEEERRKILMEVLHDSSLELNPWVIPSFSKITK